MKTHETFMRRAIALATRAQGNTSPNPLVGSVVVQGDRVVGEGWHQAAGQAHAETIALDAAGASCSGATLYVTLEPCTHQGRTPPCTDAIIKAGIKKVVYAVPDPNPNAAGGAEVLRSAGVKVLRGVLENEARDMNRFYLHAMENRKPFVVGKFAASLDGRTATRTGDSQWITGEQARKYGHRIRQSVDAILVGAQTVVTDNPQLTVRLDQHALRAPVNHPLRLVLDSTGRIPHLQRVFDPDLPGKTEVFTTGRMSQQHQKTLEQKGVTVHRVDEDTAGRVSLEGVMTELAEKNLQSLLIEGGQQMLGSFHDAQLIDEYLVFIAPLVIGGATATPSVGGHGIGKLTDASSLRFISCEKVAGDIVLRAQRKGY